MFEFISYVLIIFGLSILVIIHESGHFFAAKLSGILVEEFGFGLPPKMFGRKFGETIISLNWLPFGGFVRLYGEQHGEEKSNLPIERSFSHQTIGTRAMVIGAGVLMNFLLGWLLLSAVFMIGIPQSLLVTDMRKGSAAEMAGIKTEDEILGFPTVPDLTKYLDENIGKEIQLRIRRTDGERMIPVRLSEGTSREDGKLGVYLVEAGTPKFGFFKSLGNGFTQSIRGVGMIFGGLLTLVTGIFTRTGGMGQFVGPVGIVKVAFQATKLGFANFLQLLSMLSLNLAVFNVLPFPALDGGRLLFLLIEKISGKKMNQKTEMAFNAAGFLVLILLIAFVTVSDVLKLL